MQNNAAPGPAAPPHAQPPRGINHVVLNVRNLEVSHRFWTEIMGFRCVAELKPVPGRRRPKMRFYSGLDAHGAVTHHDLALAEAPQADCDTTREPWDLLPSRVVGASLPEQYDRGDVTADSVDAHRQALAGKSVSYQIRLADRYYDARVKYELPREVWETDIDAAQNYAERLPTEGDAALVDRTDYPVFKGTAGSGP